MIAPVTRLPAERSGTVAPLFLMAAAAGYIVAVGWALGATSFDVSGGLLIAPVLVLLTVPLARRAAQRERDANMATFVISALVLKLLASLVRYAVAFQIYDGVADAQTYHKAGVTFASSFRKGIFNFGTDRIVGTGFIKILTGFVYTVIGPTKVGGFLLFSWAGFWGLYFFYRAFCIALPDADHKRYARLVFLLPSMLFWPSSIGKEAWMTLVIGLACLGAAKLFRSEGGGLPLLLLGGVGTAIVRPHITLILALSVIAGIVVRRPNKPRLLGPIGTWLIVIVLLSASAVAVVQVEKFFELDSLSTKSVDQVLNSTQQQTGEGGSSFGASGVGSVTSVPNSFLTIVFRPFPWEAHNAQSLAASAEGVIIAGIMWRGRKRIWALRQQVLRSPYLAFSSVYVLLFVFAFASINNFGILARQRVQMFPLLLALLSLQVPTKVSSDKERFEFVLAR